MRSCKKFAAASIAVLALLGPVAGCGDDAGEDEIGDGEINDPGD